MILITNRVKKQDYLKDHRLSQAGLIYQDKLTEFVKPDYEFSFVPSFLDYNYKDEERHTYINTIPKGGKFIRKFRYISDNLFLFFKLREIKTKDILIYNIDLHNLFFVLILVFFSKRNKYVVAADYIIQKNFFLKKIFDFAYKKVDGVVILNPNIKVNANSILLPGLIRKEDIKTPQHFSEFSNAIFSGSLGKTTGFELCLSAISKLDTINLSITGKPYHYREDEFNALVSEYESKPNIKYYGLVDEISYKKLLSSSQIAFSLRDPMDAEHDFNFPSKIIEYLADGKLVISSKKYSFIPDGVLFYCDFTEDSILKVIQEIQSMTTEELQKRQRKIYSYLIENYTEKSLKEALLALEYNYAKN